MSDAILVALIMSIPATLGVFISAYNAYNLRRVEKNTNSMASRNEAIAEKLGVEKGKAAQKANPTK